MSVIWMLFLGDFRINLHVFRRIFKNQLENFAKTRKKCAEIWVFLKWHILLMLFEFDQAKKKQSFFFRFALGFNLSNILSFLHGSNNAIVWNVSFFSFAGFVCECNCERVKERRNKKKKNMKYCEKYCWFGKVKKLNKLSFLFGFWIIYLLLLLLFPIPMWVDCRMENMLRYCSVCSWATQDCIVTLSYGR